jgi:hypothetical protein
MNSNSLVHCSCFVFWLLYVLVVDDGMRYHLICVVARRISKNLLSDNGPSMLDFPFQSREDVIDYSFVLYLLVDDD